MDLGRFGPHRQTGQMTLSPSTQAAGELVNSPRQLSSLKIPRVCQLAARCSPCHLLPNLSHRTPHMIKLGRVACHLTAQRP
jgi:hypothetical protein